MLEHEGSCLRECLNVKGSFRPAVRSKKSIIAFIFLFFSCLGVDAVFVFDFVDEMFWIYTLLSLGGATFIFFLFSWLKNPGNLISNSINLIVR